MREFDLIARYFRPIAVDAGARGLMDDAAVLTPPAGRQLVITKDMIAQGVHFLAGDPPGTVARKLLAVNLSDLAAMGAAPLGCVLGLGLPQHVGEDWVAAFAQGLGQACADFGCPLVGGDTISGLDRPVLSLTAFGTVAPGAALARSGAQPGDDLWVSGVIGLGALGLALLEGRASASAGLADAAIARYRTPEPQLALGAALAGIASAAADVSDGLLADTRHIAEASGIQITIALDAVPVPQTGMTAMAAMTGGDDYELVFTAPPAARVQLVTLSQTLGLKLTRIGSVATGSGLELRDAAGLPVQIDRLGWEHEGSDGEKGPPQGRQGR